jgi:ABC-type dipeptide/oligopeptide/nickel transport system permease component
MIFVRLKKKLMVLLLQCIIAVEVLVLIAVFPVLFKNLSFNLKEYRYSIYELNIRIVTFSDSLTADGNNSLFPVIFYKYFDSMKILGLGFVTACMASFFIAYMALIFFKNKMKYLKGFLEIAQSIPDLMLILLLQFAVIMIYKKTGIKFARVVTLREEAILLPVISLSVPISIYITKVLIHYIEEELEKPYVILAKAAAIYSNHAVASTSWLYAALFRRDVCALRSRTRRTAPFCFL